MIQLLRGCKPTPRHRLARATWVGRKLAALPPPPAQFDATAGIRQLPDLGNFGPGGLGDCVACAIATLAGTIPGSTGGPTVALNKSEVEKWYFGATGGVDSGLDIDTALSRMQTTGMVDASGKAHVFGPHGVIDYTNQTEVMQALYLFKGVDIGVDAGPLERVVNPQQNGWVLTNVERASETNHSIMAAGYGTLRWAMNLLNCPVPASVNPNEFGFVGYTWSAWGFVGASSLPKIAGEMWAIVTDPDRGDAATWDPIAAADYQEITGSGVNPAPSPQPQPAPTHRSAVLMERMSKKYGVPAEHILNEFRGWVERYRAGDQQAALAELAKLEAEYPE